MTDPSDQSATSTSPRSSGRDVGLLLYAGLSLVNLLVVGLYRWFLDAPLRPLERILAVAAASSLAALIAQRWSHLGPAKWLGNLQVALFAALAVLITLEGAWRLTPSIFPSWVRDRVQTGDIDATRHAVVEYLDTSPFVKFRADTVVRSQGFRGNDEEFAYEWRTDRRGFKNAPEIATRDQVDVVALGDSFTEGMGVATEFTWPARLSQAGFPTYNLGVQGYAPSQLAGAFQGYGLSLRPRIVVIGYCAGTFAREKAFQDIEAAKRARSFTGGIQSFVDREIRQQRRFLTTTLFEAGYSAFASGVTVVKGLFGVARYPIPPPIPVVDEEFQRYANELAAVGGFPFDIRQVKEEGSLWRSAQQAFLDVRNRGRTIGARTILVYLPGRGSSYYERGTGRRLAADSFEVMEADALERFCRTHGIPFLNPSTRIRAYVASIPAGAPQDAYPYLRLDGHMSSKGHELVAEEILAFLRADEVSRP